MKKHKPFFFKCAKNISPFSHSSNTSNKDVLYYTIDKSILRYYNENKMAFEVDPKTSSYKPRPISYTIICPISRLLQCISYLIILVLKLIGLDVQFLFYITMRMYRMIKNVIIIYIDKVRPNPFGHTCNMFCTKKELYRHGGTSKICILIFLCSLLLHSFFDLDIYLAKRFLGGQVVIKRTLNFDYIMEHPIPIVNLLLKKVLEKIKSYFPSKVFPKKSISNFLCIPCDSSSHTP